jgi:ankyrin repeat protein
MSDDSLHHCACAFKLNAKIASESMIDPSVPLLCAVIKAHFRCTSYLLDINADVNIADSNGISALTWSCTVGNLDVCKALLRNGARLSLDAGVATMGFGELRRAYIEKCSEDADHYVYSRFRHLASSSKWKGIRTKQNRNLIVSPMMAALIKGVYPDNLELSTARRCFPSNLLSIPETS